MKKLFLILIFLLIPSISLATDCSPSDYTCAQMESMFDEINALSGDIVGTDDSQTLTTKTIDADDNTLNDFPVDINWPFSDPIDAQAIYLKLQRALTISSIGCIVDPADSSESVVVDIQECDSNGDNCVTSLSSTITCANTPTAGTISDGAYDSGDFILIDLGTVTGTVTSLTIYGQAKESY